MNERIKELARTAEREVQISLGERWTTVGRAEFMRLYNEKFAELIVRECCSKLEEMGEGWQEFAKNPPQGQAHNASGALFAAYRLKEDAVDEIKEHFGVK